MSDQASFVAALIDRVSGPARKMRGQLGQLGRSIRALNQTAKRGAANKLGGVLARAGFTAKGTEKAFKNLGKSLKKMRSEAISSLGSGLKDGLVLGGVAAAGLAAGIGYATAKMAMFGQESNLAFNQLSKHGASGAKLFAHARGIAEQFGLDVMETTDQFKSLLAVQFNPKVATDILKMGADMRVLGQDGEKVSGIITALGQIKSKGRLQAEELMQLNERSISSDLVKGQLAKAMGVDRASIDGLISQGKVGANEAIAAVLGAVKQKLGEQNIGDAGQAFADNMLAGMFGKLKAKAQNQLIDIGQQITPVLESTFKAVGGELSKLLENKDVQEGVIVAFERVGQLVKDAIPFVKKFAGEFVGGFKEAWPPLQQALGALFDGFGGGQSDWLKNVGSFAKTLGQVAAFGVTVATVFGGMVLAGIQLVTGAVQLAQGAWGGLINGVGAAAFAVFDFFDNIAAKWRAFDFGALATSLIDGLVNGIRNGVSRVVSAVGDLGQATLASFKSVLGIASPSKEFEYFGQMSGMGFQRGLAGALAANDNSPRLSAFTAAVQPIANVGAGGVGGVTVNVRVTNNFQGGDSEEHARTFDRSLESRLGGIFERLAAQAAA